MSSTALHNVIEAAGWVVLTYLGQGTLLFILLAFSLALLAKSPARIRYGLCYLTLVVLCLLPGVLLVMQAIDTSHVNARILTPQAVQITHAGRDTHLELADTNVQSGLGHGRSTPLPKWLWMATLLWIVGITFFLIRFAAAYGYLYRLIRHRTTTVPPLITRELQSLCSQANIRRPVSVRQSQQIATPFMCGHYHPCIVLPAYMLVRFSVPEIRTILAHELAHIKRRDYLMNLLQHFAEALLFFHPGMWWLSKRLRLEREYCCDDLVTTTFAQDRQTYVRALVKLPEMSTYVLAATESELVTRVRRLSAASPSRLAATHMLLVVVLAPLALIGHVLDAPRTPLYRASPPNMHVRATMIGGATLYDLYRLMDAGGLTHLPVRSRLILEAIAADGSTKRVTIRSDGTNNLYAFTVNGQVRDFDLEAQTWLAELWSSTIEPLLETFNEDALHQVSAVQDRVNDKTISLILEPHHDRHRHLVPVSHYIDEGASSSPDRAFLEARLVYAFHAVAHGLGNLDELRRFLDDLEASYGFTLDGLP